MVDWQGKRGQEEGEMRLLTTSWGPSEYICKERHLIKSILPEHHQCYVQHMRGKRQILVGICVFNPLHCDLKSQYQCKVLRRANVLILEYDCLSVSVTKSPIANTPSNG